MFVKDMVLSFADRAKEIRSQRGNLEALKVGLLFVISPIYKRESFYLYENPPRPEYDSSEAKPAVDLAHLNFRVITSNEEADALENEGYAFRDCPTYFNHGLRVYRKWLDCGTIAFCTFVGNEFAAINWVIPSEQAQIKVKAPPLRVDYQNNEVFPRGAWVSSRFRRLELYRYTLRNRDRYLVDLGVKKLRVTVDITNKAGIGITEANMSRRYGTGTRTRVFWWTFWYEVYSLY